MVLFELIMNNSRHSCVFYIHIYLYVEHRTWAHFVMLDAEVVAYSNKQWNIYICIYIPY